MNFFNFFKKKKDKEVVKKYKPQYIYCSSNLENGRSLLHIRLTSTAGPQYISGIDTESLCGFANPTVGGFDYIGDIKISERNKICPICFSKYSEISMYFNYQDGE